MSDYQVEDGVEIPPITRTRDSVVYPFADMSVGQSFMISVDELVPMFSEEYETEIAKIEAKMRTASLRFTKAQCGAVKFTIRQVPGGVRCWRVA